MFSKPVHAVRAWGGPLGTNHGLFKAKPSSNHVHSTLRMTGGGGWGHPQGAVHMVAARLGFEKAMVGTGRATPHGGC